ncbi:MAG: ribonuclease E/G [Candidatus Kariarchaeaceae archaeon]
MVNCRLNSIFYRSLAKIIKEETNFVLIATSEKQAKDLEIEHLRDVVEVEVSDLDDFTGIQIHGNPDAVKVLEEIMFDNFSDAIIRRQPIQLHAIYQGRVVHYNHHKQFGILDIGESFNAIMFSPDLKRGQEMTVQIKQLPPSEDQLPVVSDTIHISGDFVILEVEGDYVRVSRKVVGDDRKKVYELGNEIKPGKFGVIMRTSAINAEIEAVQEEVNSLVGLWEDLELDVSTAFEPERLSGGEAATNIYLPGRSKRELSKIKNSIAKSLPDYYSLNTYSRYSQSILSLTDKLVDDIDPMKLQKAIYQTILEEDFIPERFVRLELSNLMLEAVHLNIGYPDLNINENEMVFVKRIDHTDEIEREDDEGVKGIELGDIVKTITALNSWTTHRQYFGQDEEIKAEKVIIHTPLEISYRGKMRAIDLGIWLIKDKNGFIVEYNNEDIEYHIDEKEVNPRLKELVAKVNIKVMEKYEQTMVPVVITDV